jgi:hypothetical protein
VSNEAINDNLKKRFENGEIYVRRPPGTGPAPAYYTDTEGLSD